MATPGGAAYVYDHGLSRSLGMAPTNYARYTMPMLVELGMNGVPAFDREFLAPFGNTVADLLSNREPFEHADLLASDVGGGKSRAGIGRSDYALRGERGSSNFFASFMPLVRFDPSGRIYRAATQAAEIEDNTITYAAGLVYAFAALAVDH